MTPSGRSYRTTRRQFNLISIFLTFPGIFGANIYWKSPPRSFGIIIWIGISSKLFTILSYQIPTIRLEYRFIFSITKYIVCIGTYYSAVTLWCIGFFPRNHTYIVILAKYFIQNLLEPVNLYVINSCPKTPRIGKQIMQQA